MSEVALAAARAREGAGLFATPRGLISIAGRDRVRWLNGMISGDVTLLAEGPERSGCYALLLTPKGGIVADLHVLFGEECLRLDVDVSATAEVIARLARYVVADDVTLEDVSAQVERLALEGPDAARLLARAGATQLEALRPDAWLATRIGETPVHVAAWGVSGEPAFQLYVPAGGSSAVRAALAGAAARASLPFALAGPEALEVLRVEAGVPRQGLELDEDVLPAEARLTERAVSLTKGCYTGQEIVARVESRGRVNHLLVGLAFEASSALPAAGTALRDGDKRVGEVTSVALSQRCGPIGLGYVRRPLDVPGTELQLEAVEGGLVRVSALPFVGPEPLS